MKEVFFNSTDFTLRCVSMDNILHNAPPGSIEHSLRKFQKSIVLVELAKNAGVKMMIRDIGLVKRDCDQFSLSRCVIYHYVIYFEGVNATSIIPY